VAVHHPSSPLSPLCSTCPRSISFTVLSFPSLFVLFTSTFLWREHMLVRTGLLPLLGKWDLNNVSRALTPTL
jgi:hypothetical protein